MEKTKKFIAQNRESLDIYAGFADYNVLFETIDRKETADNCIESCKALIEGISKTILMKVDVKSLEISILQEYEQENLRKSIDQIISERVEFRNVFRQAVTALSAYHHACEKEFLLIWGNKFCDFVGNIRNKQGDVSHGRVVPKKINSTMDLAHMVEQITDILASHMLEIFSLIDFSRSSVGDKDRLVDESFMYKTEIQLAEVDEEEKFIREFNDYLDSFTPLEGKLRYSLALYQQSPDDYYIQLSDYKLEQEDEEL